MGTAGNPYYRRDLRISRQNWAMFSKVANFPSSCSQDSLVVEAEARGATKEFLLLWGPASGFPQEEEGAPEAGQAVSSLPKGTLKRRWESSSSS